jgi:hypothetical protein
MTTRFVGTGSFATIQAAVDAANSGDTILGVWSRSVMVQL